MFYRISPNLIGLLNTVKRDIMSSINCISIGKVLDYDMEHRVCDVQLQFVPANIQYDPKLATEGEDYPILRHCVILGEHFQSPIKEGDNCLVLFCDKCIDRWFIKDERGKPANYRKHDLSDGFVLFEIGNLVKSSYIAPEGYEPPASLPPICDCPIPKYGYQEGYTRLRADSGDISIGDVNAEQRGVTICARDYSSINMYAEGSAGDMTAGNINLHPTNSFNVSSDVFNFTVHGDSDEGYDPINESSGVENPPVVNVGGKITLSNGKLSKTIGEDPEKPDNWWAGKTVPISDMYRILAQCKACLSEASKLLASLGATTTSLDGAIMDFKDRYYNLFAPADPTNIDIENNNEEA